jgi:hypothetical protein
MALNPCHHLESVKPHGDSAWFFVYGSFNGGDDSVGTLTSLWVVLWRKQGLIPDRRKRFSQTGPRATQTLWSADRGFFPCRKDSESVADHSPPCRKEVKNVWR